MTQNQKWPKIKSDPKSNVTKNQNWPKIKVTQNQKRPTIKSWCLFLNTIPVQELKKHNSVNTQVLGICQVDILVNVLMLSFNVLYSFVVLYWNTLNNIHINMAQMVDLKFTNYIRISIIEEVIEVESSMELWATWSQDAFPQRRKWKTNYDWHDRLEK